MRVPVFLTSLPAAVMIPGAFPRGTPLNARLDESELRHLVAVLRLRPGARIELSDPSRGIAVSGIIRVIDADLVTVEVEQTVVRPPTPRLTVIVGSVKPDRCELVVEKTTEIGVQRIVFYDADRTNRPLSSGNTAKRLARLTRIAEGAVKQSAAGSLPDIVLAPNLADALTRIHGVPQGSESRTLFSRNRFVFVAPAEDNTQPPEPTAETNPTPFPQLLRNSLLETSPSDVDFHLVIGPEGGFTSPEIACVLTYGYERASLGPRVLRSETAAIVGCAAVSLGIF